MLEMPPAPPSAFIAHAAQQASYTPGYERTAMGGIPELGALNMLALPAMSSVMAQFGMFPGQFTPQVNVADLLRAERDRTTLMRRMALAAQQVDVDTWVNQTAGLMEAIDAPFGLEQQAAFRRTYRAAAPMLSMLGQVAPELVDSLHGSRGSAALMVRGLTRGGQYQFDAIAPGLGLSDATVETLQRTIDTSLYNTPEAAAKMLGVGMGQLGQIYDEAARRGLLPGSIAARDRESQLTALSAATGRDRGELAALSADDFGQQLRQFDATRTTTRLRDLAGSVSAMRELFGSQGQPNAPMSVLINALEQLTQNRLASMPPGQVEQLVRRTKAVVETTGVSLDALFGLSTQGAQYGDALGLDRSFALQSAQGAVTFGTAYKNTFGSDFRAFGAMSADEVTARDNMLRQRAAGSEQALFAGAVIRAAERFELGAATPIGRLADALKRGETQFEGRSMYEVLRQDELTRMMAASGTTDAEVAAFRTATRDTFGNQEYIARYNLDALTRRLQPEEIVDTIGRAAGENAIMQAMTQSGATPDAANAAARKAGPALMRALLQSDDPEALSTEAGRAAIIKRALATELGDDTAARVGDAVAMSFESQANTQARRVGFGDLTKLLQQQNATTLRAASRVTRAADAQAQLDAALAPLGKAGPIQRVMDMLRDGKADDDIRHVLGIALGGIDVAQVRELIAHQDKIRRLRSKDTLTDAEAAEAVAAEKALSDVVAHIVASGEASGADIGRVVTDDALRLAGPAAADAVTKARASGDVAKIEDAVKTQLARSNNLVQALYVDDKALRRMGPGGFDKLRRAEQNYLQMLRAAGGNTHVLARALAGDTSIDERTRTLVKELQGELSSSMTDVQRAVSGGAGMSDAAWAAESAAIKTLRDERSSDDDAQTQRLLDQLAASTGSGALSAEDRAQLAPLLGGVDTTRRRDISEAIAARDRLVKIAEERRVPVSDLRSDPKLRADVRQAGPLLDIPDAGVDAQDMKRQLERFGERPSPTGAAARGVGDARGPLEITGRLLLVGDGTAELSGSGFSH